MEKDQTHNQTSLSIGGFTIAYSSGCASLPMPIPPSGLKFCQSGKPTADFHVAAECSEPDRSETLLFGSEQFYPSIFLYQSQSGTYHWQLRDHTGSTQLGFLISPDWKHFTLYQDTTQSNGMRAFQEFGTMFPYARPKPPCLCPPRGCYGTEGKGILSPPPPELEKPPTPACGGTGSTP